MTPSRDVLRWFPGWLDFHQFLFRHLSFVDYKETRGPVYYAAWIEEFGRLDATYDLAAGASKALQRRDDLQDSIGHHLPALCAMIARLSTELSARAPRVMTIGERARSESRDCPECRGTGLARRRTVMAGFPWNLAVCLYCRCPLGRYLLDRDQTSEAPPCYDDLQALPELWSNRVSHASWSDRPAARARQAFEPNEFGVRYLRPGERKKDRPPGSTPSNPGDRPQPGITRDTHRLP